MLEVPDGRIGHRHAWWPMDKYDEECRDWAEQRRGLADPHKEAVWLVRLGWRGRTSKAVAGAEGRLQTGEQHQQREQHRQRDAATGASKLQEWRTALLALEDLGTHYVAGGLMGLEWRWGEPLEMVPYYHQAIVHSR